MNPLLQQALGSIIRAILAGGAAWLVERGVWTKADSQTYLAAGALAVLSIGWSIWQKYKSRISFLTALSLPAGSTQMDVKEAVAAGAVPPANTPPDVPPVAAKPV